MRYHIVLLLACGSPVLGFVSQMRHGGPRPRDLQTARRLPVCLSFSACCFLCFGLRAGPRGPYFESVCYCFCVCSTGTATRSDPQSRRARANYTFRCGIRYFI